MVRRREGTNWGPVCLVALMALDFGRVINLAWPDLTCSAPARPGATGRRPGCVRLPVRPAASGFEWGPERHGPSPDRSESLPGHWQSPARGVLPRTAPASKTRRARACARMTRRLGTRSSQERTMGSLLVSNYQSRRNVMTFSTCFVCGNMSNGVQSRTR